MAIDPNILLGIQPINFGQALLQGLQGAQSIYSMRQSMEEAERRKKMQPYEDAMMEMKNQQIALQGRAMYSQQALPFLQSGDVEGLKKFTSESSLLDNATKRRRLELINTNQLTPFLGELSGDISTAQQFGIIKTPIQETKKAIIQEAEFLYPNDRAAQAKYIQAYRQKPTGTNVTVQMPGQQMLSAEARALGASLVKDYEQVQAMASSAESQRNILNQLSAIDITTGFGQQTKADIANVLNGLGVNGDMLLNTDVAKANTVNKLTGKLVSEALQEQKGVASDADMRFFLRNVPSITDDQRAYQFNINSMDAIAQRKIEKERFYTDWFDRKGTLKGAKKSWNDYINSTPLWSTKAVNPSTGLPVNFYEFKNEAVRLNPNAVESDILSNWKKFSGGR